MNYHSGDIYQRGSGLGSFFSGLFKSVVPLAKSFLKSSTGQTLKNVALSTASNVAKDIIEGRNVKESAKENLGDAKQKIKTLIKKKFDLDPDEIQPTQPPKRKSRNKKVIGSKIKKLKFNLLDE